MGAPDILAVLAARGLSIRPLPGGLLEVSPRERLTDQLRDLIRAHRAEILTALGGYAAPPTENSCGAKLAGLRRLILAVAAADPEHWSEADVAAALNEGEQDLEAAIRTWREVLARTGVSATEDRRAAERRHRALAMLARRPDARYALISDPDDPAHPGEVVFTVAVRHAGGDSASTVELLVSQDRYDPILLLDLVDRYGTATH